MPLRYLLDEHLRGGSLWRAIRQHNTKGIQPLDILRVGDALDLPLGSTDPEILTWAEREGRILVTLDEQTLPGHLANHLQCGRHSPGIYVIRRGKTLPQILSFLVDAAYGTDSVDWQDRIAYVP